MSESPLSDLPPAGPDARRVSRFTNRRRMAGLLLLGAVVAGAGWWWLGGQEAGEGGPGGKGGGPKPTPIVVEAATTENFPVRLTAIGTVVPRTVVTVRSRVDGTLNRVLFREGQTVRAGELLAEIDPRPFEVALTQAQGQLARDEALLANARADLARYDALAKLDAIPVQQLDTQRALVRQYEGAVKIDQGVVDNARLQLSYTRITAPSDGRIGLRQVDPGNLVRASDASGLVVITEVQPVTVVFPVTEADLPGLLSRVGLRSAPERRPGEGREAQAPAREGISRQGARALGEMAGRDSRPGGEARSAGEPGRRARGGASAEAAGRPAASALAVEAWDREGKALLATGELLSVDNQIDVTTGTVKAKALFANRDGALFPNQFVNVRLVLRELTAATVIPAAAVQRGARGAFVWRLNEDKTVSMTPVTVGAADNERVPVLAGLNPGDAVAVDGFDRLRDGGKVDVVSRESRNIKGGNGGGGGKRGPRPGGEGGVPPAASAGQGVAGAPGAADAPGGPSRQGGQGPAAPAGEAVPAATTPPGAAPESSPASRPAQPAARPGA